MRIIEIGPVSRTGAAIMNRQIMEIMDRVQSKWFSIPLHAWINAQIYKISLYYVGKKSAKSAYLFLYTCKFIQIEITNNVLEKPDKGKPA